MKAFCTLFSILITSSFFAQSMEGSWQLTHENGEMLTKNEVIAIYQDGYFAVGAKEARTNKFLFAYGGEYSFKGRSYSETQDFNTRSPQRVGKTMDFKATLKDDQLELSSGGHTQTWQRRSSKTDALTRNWVITGRERDNKMNTMTPGDRRTIKILSGGHFQWVAFNSAAKEFSGTGGGTYSVNNDTYTEHITFFSRDDSRVGASLQFQFEVKEGQWHHKGNSSKGDPIYEIWSPYEVAYKK